MSQTSQRRKMAGADGGRLEGVDVDLLGRCGAGGGELELVVIEAESGGGGGPFGGAGLRRGQNLRGLPRRLAGDRDRKRVPACDPYQPLHPLPREKSWR